MMLAVPPQFVVSLLVAVSALLIGNHGLWAGRPGENGPRPQFSAVIADAGDVTEAKAAQWKIEGFRAAVLILEDRHSATVLASAAKALADNSLALYFWVEVARDPELARSHPDLMASLGMHDDWRRHFPKFPQAGPNEVVKAWPWVPICYRDAFAAHKDRIKRLLARLPAGYTGLLLNDLQGGPASCGCGNLQCRWAVDYGVPATAARQPGSDAAARFVADIGKLTAGKELIPVWTTECEHEDLPRARLTAKDWATGYCGGVPCFETCRKRFGEQWQAMTGDRQGPVGLLVLSREFHRDRKEYGGPGAWVKQVLDYIEKQTLRPLPRQKVWLVVQGYEVSREEEAAARQHALETGAGAVLVARRRLDQSYEPRMVKRPVGPIP
jgi:hypothetical protein